MRHVLYVLATKLRQDNNDMSHMT